MSTRGQRRPATGRHRTYKTATDHPDLRAVLFDLDDTLFDHQASSRAGLTSLREGFPVLAGVPFDAFEQSYRVIMEEIHLLVLSGEITPTVARERRFRRFLSETFPASLEDAQHAAQLYHRGFHASRRPIEGAQELLRHLRERVRIGVITNNVRHEQVDKLRHLELEPLVDVLVTSEETGVAKPHPDIFHSALKQLDCTADQVVMVGDNWVNDIVGASGVGIRGIWLNRYGEPHIDAALAPEILALAPLEEIAALIGAQLVVAPAP